MHLKMLLMLSFFSMSCGFIQFQPIDIFNAEVIDILVNIQYFFINLEDFKTES